MARHPPACRQLRLLHDRLRRALLLGHRRVDRAGARHGDRHEHVDAAAPPGRHLDGRGHRLRARSRPRRRPRGPTRTRPRGRPPAWGSPPSPWWSGRGPGCGGTRRRRGSRRPASTVPAAATARCSSVTVTQASPVPSPPTTANIGRRRPASADRARAAVGPRAVRVLEAHARSTEMWAIVNESIAPNAYMFPRKSACPGIRATQAMRAEDDDPDPRRAELAGAAGAARRGAGGAGPSSRRAATRR